MNEIKKITNLGARAICVTADSPIRSIKYDISQGIPKKKLVRTNPLSEIILFAFRPTNEGDSSFISISLLAQPIMKHES